MRLGEGLSPVGCAAGATALVAYCPLEGSLLFAWAIAATLLLSALGVTFAPNRPAPLRRAGVRLLFSAAGLLFGLFLFVNEHQDRAAAGLALSRVASYEVRIVDDGVHTRNGSILHRGILFAVNGRDGTRAAASGTIALSGGRSSYDWGTRLEVPGAPQREAALGTDWVGRISSKEARVVGKQGWYFALRTRMKQWVVARMERLGGGEAALFMALFLGVRDDLGAAEAYFFRRAGAIHLLALSGFHLGILSVILVGLLAPLFGRPRAALIAAVFLAGYLFVAGPKVSLLRAVLMFTLLGACRSAHIKARGVDLLGLSFLLSAAVWPGSMKTLSFELSYLALFGILVLAPAVTGRTSPYLPKAVRVPLSASIGAQIATAPVLALRFGLLYPAGLLSSLLLTPLVTAFLWGGLGFLLLPLPPFLAAAARELLALVHLLLFRTVELCARAAPLQIDRPSAAVLASGLAAAAVELPALAGLLRRVLRSPAAAPKG